MKKHAHFTSIFTMTTLLVFIFDTKTVVSGASKGIELCLRTLIPALFPFLVVSTLSSKLLLGFSSKTLSMLLRPCKLPEGTESIFLISILGGYPIGAKLIWDEYKSNKLSKSDANRMLMFCNNGGPSFIFGILAQFFTKFWIPWVIWSLHILSAYLVGILTADTPSRHTTALDSETFNIAESISSAVNAMGRICGWVVLFRLLLAFLDKWFLETWPPCARTLVIGLLELSNGCTSLLMVKNLGLRFLFSLGFITFGGFCIVMQTQSIAPGLSIKQYLRGKLYQCIIVFTIALPIQAFMFPTPYKGWPIPFIISVFLICFVTIKRPQKNSSFLRSNVI